MAMVNEDAIIRHAASFVRQKGRLRVFVAQTTTVTFSVDSEFRQICQVGFSSDGSIRLAWPYVAVREGIVSDVEIPDDGKSHTIELQERGRFTSQLVKFSHHVSGRAHFSLSDKVRSDVGRDSFPLDGPIGRIFELTIVLPAEFRPLDRLKRGRLYANFTGRESFPDALQIRGEWRRRDDLIKNATPKRSTSGLRRLRFIAESAKSHRSFSWRRLWRLGSGTTCY